MTARPNVGDRPLLRLFNPELQGDWTVQRAFDELRLPDLEARSKSHCNDGKRWMRLWAAYEATLPSRDRSPPYIPPETTGFTVHGQRIHNPLLIKDITSHHLRGFQRWLAGQPKPLSASSINKCVGEVALVLRIAGQEGVEVQSLRPARRLRTAARPRFYLADDTIARLWSAAARMDWPPRKAATRRNSRFAGTGVDPVDFWRALIVLLRCYGPRIQDFCSYTKDKRGLTWRDITTDDLSPNPESEVRWPHGWLQYVADKTVESSARKYYLPLLPVARAAVERLRAGASEVLWGGALADAPIFRIPKSHGLPEQWGKLQSLADVQTRTGIPYQLEDFRKTVATFAAPVHSDLPWALCGWGGSSVARRHYQNPDPLLVEFLPRMSLPQCFSQW